MDPGVVGAQPVVEEVDAKGSHLEQTEKRGAPDLEEKEVVMDLHQK